MMSTWRRGCKPTAVMFGCCQSDEVPRDSNGVEMEADPVCSMQSPVDAATPRSGEEPATEEDGLMALSKWHNMKTSAEAATIGAIQENPPASLASESDEMAEPEAAKATTEGTEAAVEVQDESEIAGCKTNEEEPQAELVVHEPQPTVFVEDEPQPTLLSADGILPKGETDEAITVEMPAEPREFTIIVKKVGGCARLGLDLDKDWKAWYIKGVNEQGLVARWNADNPKHQVRAKDLVVKVNNVEGSLHTMMEEMRKAQQLVLAIRPALR